MISLRKISRHYQQGGQQLAALQDIDLEIGPGEYISIMGPSGSGKSTLLNQIALLDRPTSGTYLLHGRDVTGLPDDEQARIRRENMGFVFQFFHLIPRLSAAENIEIPLVLSGVDSVLRKQQVAKAMLSFGLQDRSTHRPDQLSGGECQRVAIARATIMHPGTLLADEPTGNLDQATGKQVIDLLEQLNRQGVTLIMVTHDPAIGERASRRVKIVDGRISSDA